MYESPLPKVSNSLEFGEETHKRKAYFMPSHPVQCELALHMDCGTAAEADVLEGLPQTKEMKKKVSYHF